MKLTLIEKKSVGENVITFVFKSEEPLVWKPGQYMRYHLDDPASDDRGENRFFTISSSPSEKNICITTRLVPDGGSTFKKNLQKLNIGDTIDGFGPNGSFIIEDASKDYAFIAGGIGVTPFRSIIKEFAVTQQQTRITLLYANRTDDVVFKNEFEEIAHSNPNIKINYLIGDYVIDEEIIRKYLPDLSKPMFYISGPEPMVLGLEKKLVEMGVSDEKIKRDYFPGYSQI